MATLPREAQAQVDEQRTQQRQNVNSEQLQQYTSALADIIDGVKQDAAARVAQVEHEKQDLEEELRIKEEMLAEQEKICSAQANIIQQFQLQAQQPASDKPLKAEQAKTGAPASEQGRASASSVATPIRNAKVDADTLAAITREQEAEIKKMHRKYDKAKDAYYELNEAYKRLSAEHSSKVQEIEQQKASLKTQHAELELVGQRLENLQTEKQQQAESHAQIVAELTSAVQQKAREIDSLQQSLGNAQNQGDLYSVQNQALQVQLTQATEQSNRLQEDLNTALELNTVTSATLEQVREQLHAVRLQLDDVSAQKFDLDSRVATLAAELDSNKILLDTTKREYQEVRAQNAVLQQKNSTAKRLQLDAQKKHGEVVMQKREELEHMNATMTRMFEHKDAIIEKLKQKVEALSVYEEMAKQAIARRQRIEDGAAAAAAADVDDLDASMQRTEGAINKQKRLAKSRSDGARAAGATPQSLQKSFSSSFGSPVRHAYAPGSARADQNGGPIEGLDDSFIANISGSAARSAAGRSNVPGSAAARSPYAPNGSAAKGVMARSPYVSARANSAKPGSPEVLRQLVFDQHGELVTSAKKKSGQGSPDLSKASGGSRRSQSGRKARFGTTQ